MSPLCQEKFEMQKYKWKTSQKGCKAATDLLFQVNTLIPCKVIMHEKQT